MTPDPGRVMRVRTTAFRAGAAALAAALLVGLPPPVSSAPGEGAASSPRFDLPIRCVLGEDCFIQNYFDRDPGPGWRDYACGALAYDGHDGTDFRLLDLAQMERGVEVLAAASGRVVATRDGEPDMSLRERGRDAVAGREAGNAVRIDHGGGWETQYSHLKRGSVRVRPGQRVERGEPLGLVGLSGKTEFPHVHFSVRHHGRRIDPFDPQSEPSQAAGGCASGPTAASVWREELADRLRYIPTGVLVAGFAAGEIDRGRAQRGEYLASAIDASAAPALVFFVESFGVRAGDRERLEIEGPDGSVFVRSDRTVDRNLAVRFGVAGKRAGPAGWAPGRYLGRYRVEREGRVVASAQRELIIR